MSNPTSQRHALAALSAAYFVFGTGSLAVIGLVEPMSAQWQVSHAAVAQLVTVFALAFAVLAPAVQVVAARLPRRTLIVAGLLTVAIGLLGTALAPNVAAAVVFRVVTALGAAAVGPVASSLATSVVPADRQAQALSTVFAGMTIATVVGVPLAAWLGHLLSWQWVFVVLAAAAALCAQAVRAFVCDTGVAAAVKPRDLLVTLTRPASRWAFGATMAQMAAQFATYSLIAIMLRERFGATPGQVSVVLMAFGVGGVVANALIGRMGDRLSVETWIRGSLAALAAVFAGLLFIAPHFVFALLLVAAWALVATLFMVPQQKRLITLGPAQRGLLLAVNASSLYLGMSLGTIVGSAAHGLLGVRALPLASLVLVGVAALSHSLSVRAARLESSATGVQGPLISEPPQADGLERCKAAHRRQPAIDLHPYPPLRKETAMTNTTQQRQTEANKTIVANYYARVWNARSADAVPEYVAADYIQHNPQVPNGRAPLQAFLGGLFKQMPQSSFTVARLVADGDLVVAHCLFKANEADRGMAVVDIYRVSDAMLVEHWDVKEPVPETSANGHSMV